MPRKTIHKDKVGKLRMSANDRVLIEGIKLIVSYPGIENFDLGKSRNSFGKANGDKYEANSAS